MTNDLYKNNQSRIDTVVGDKYFVMLGKIREEFAQGRITININEFQQYLIDTYGIRMEYNSNGLITGSYEVINEQKYIVAVLKFK